MRLSKVEVANFRGIRKAALEIPPDVHQLIIGGRNGAGKTSLLNALLFLLQGAGGMENAEYLLADGAETLRVSGEFIGQGGELEMQVTRTGPAGRSLIVKDAEGKTRPRPQDYLNQLFNRGLDPMEFVRMSAEEQRVAFKRITGVNTDDIDAEINDINRISSETARLRQAALTRIGNRRIDEMLPADELDAANLIGQIQTAIKHNAEKTERQANLRAQEKGLKAAENDLDRLNNEKDELLKRIAEAETQAELWRDGVRNARNGIESFIEIDTEPLNAQLSDIKARNELIKENNELREQMRLLDELEVEQKKLNQEHRDKLEERKRSVSLSRVPYPGLEMTEKGIALNGKSLAVNSETEQVLAGAALALAGNPEIRLILVPGGSGIGYEAIKALEEYCRDNDALFIMERYAAKPEDLNGLEFVFIENGTVGAT